jgi:predicted nucleic acid-binding protein
MNVAVRAIDANIILRYLLNDNRIQSELAAQLIDSDRPLGLTAVALAEVAWTLAGPRYGRARGDISQALIDLLARRNIIAIGFDKAEAQAAMLTCLPETGAATFGDALIAACARSAGVREIYTFDRRFARAGLVPIDLGPQSEANAPS